ncbi:hypothetical protein WJX84_007970 [Apatococcus fuscideae]|uniref:Uncharacterized protein n=1 Tax=Apatococcus fuscideae TaxID=2026836 RepID=A0AAW1TGC4_9CHLO
MDSLLDIPLGLKVNTNKRSRGDDGLGTPQHLPKVKAVAMRILTEANLTSTSPTSLISQLTREFSDHEAQGEDTTAELLQHAPAIMDSALDYAELHCNTPQAKMDPPADLSRSLCFSPLPSLSGSDPDPRLVSAVSEAISPKAAGFKRVPSSELGAAASSAESPKAHGLSPVASPTHAQADPMYLVHPSLAQPLAEHMLPLISLEDLASLRSSCRAFSSLDTGSSGFSEQSFQQQVFPCMPTMPSPFQAS